MRYVPFPVMAGFLAASGWLLAVGAMTIIVGTPLNLENAVRITIGAWQPVAGAAAVALVLFALSSRLPGSVLMPIVVAVTTLVVHAVLASPLCAADACEPSRCLVTVTRPQPTGSEESIVILRDLNFHSPFTLAYSSLYQPDTACFFPSRNSFTSM